MVATLTESEHWKMRDSRCWENKDTVEVDTGDPVPLADEPSPFAQEEDRKTQVGAKA